VGIKKRLTGDYVAYEASKNLRQQKFFSSDENEKSKHCSPFTTSDRAFEKDTKRFKYKITLKERIIFACEGLQSYCLNF